MTLSIISAIFGLIGCPGDKCDTGDSTCETGEVADTDTDTDTDTDADTDINFAFNWSATGLDLAITNGTGQYSVGFAETSAGGWEGEDCLDGPGPSGNSGPTDVCHDAVPATGISLAKATVLADVEANVATLITDTIANGGNLETIASSNADGTCWTWGGGTYYSAAGFSCTAM